MKTIQAIINFFRPGGSIKGEELKKPNLRTIFPPGGKKDWYGEHQFNKLLGK